MYQLVVYIPESHCEAVKQAMFDAGAGRYENYEHCSWQVQGQGQFKPMAGANPFIGNQNQLQTVEEYRVEMICEAHCLHAAVTAMIQTHPYEEPAYLVLKHTAIEFDSYSG